MTALHQGPDGSSAAGRRGAHAATPATDDATPATDAPATATDDADAHGAAPPPPDDVPPRHAGERAQGFGAVVGWTVVGSLVPGAGLLAAGRRRAGVAVLVVAGLLVAAAAVSAVVLDPLALARQLVADPNRLVLAAAALVGLTLAWVVLVLVTHVALRREATLTTVQQALGGTLVAALVGLVAVPAVIVGNDALVARSTLRSVFGSGTRLDRARTPQAAAPDPWAAVPRVNVLLMGGDSGADRTGVRPDTMIVASIDTHTGDTVLISLPRNLQHVPFPPGSRGAADYPNGFSCYNAAAGANTECLLNALWAWGDSHPAYYPGDRHPGLTATIQGVEQVTGLQVDEYVMLNLRGFQEFVDIIGGLEVNVTERLPVGGSVEHPVASSWLEPGRQKLSGYLALWYARSRWSTTDYDRMRRQRCVIGDVVQQVDPVTVALRFSRVAATLQQNLQTSIQLGELNAWVTLAERVKRAHVRSLAFTDQVINTANPDIPRMHELVSQALVPPAASPPPSSGSSASPGTRAPGTPTGGTSAPPTSTASRPVTPSATPSPGQAQDVNQVC